MTQDQDTSTWRFPGALKDYLRESREIFQGSAEKCAGSRAEEYAMLVDTDQLLSDSIRELKLEGDVFGNLLGVSGYMMWLAAIRNAMSGHAAAVFPLLRTSLESICYWARIEDDPELSKVWLDRGQSLDARKKARNAFNSAVKDVANKFGPHHAKLSGLTSWSCTTRSSTSVRTRIRVGFSLAYRSGKRER